MVIVMRLPQCGHITPAVVSLAGRSGGSHWWVALVGNFKGCDNSSSKNSIMLHPTAAAMRRNVVKLTLSALCIELLNVTGVIPIRRAISF